MLYFMSNDISVDAFKKLNYDFPLCYQSREKIRIEVHLGEMWPVDGHLPVGRGLLTIIRRNSTNLRSLAQLRIIIN